MDSTQHPAGAPAPVSFSPVRALDASAKPRPKLLAALRKPTAESSESGPDSDNATSASEDESPALTAVSKPLPTRRPPLDTDQANDVDDNDGEDAYELMKRRLAATKAQVAAETVPQQDTPVLGTAQSSDEEDDMPVRTKVRRPAAKTTATMNPRASPSSTARSRSASPGLFVTPDPSPAKKRSKPFVDAGSDSESSQPTPDAHLQARVRRIREERLARQQEQESEQTSPNKTTRRSNEQGSESDTDGESGRRLTQQAKPTRRAGKKAMEAMARDQQRISRNMQLTHQAKTKKRFTTQHLFKKLNFQAPSTDSADSAALPTPEPSSALASSDAEVNQAQKPLSASLPRSKDVAEAHLSTSTESTSALMSETDNGIHSPNCPKLDKGKGRAAEFQHLPEHPWMERRDTTSYQDALVDTKKTPNDAMVELSDSDDDPSMHPPKSRFPVFDRLPVRKQCESGSLVRLRALAQLTKSPPKGRKGQKSVTRGEMEVRLAQKAREQTIKAREERIADLIKRGLNPETEEEKERRQEEIDDMVALLEKQRQEDLQLAQKEKNEAKQNGEAIDGLPSSDDEDGDYVGSGDDDADEDGEEDGEENQAQIEFELSGSEDEDMNQDDAEGSQVGDDDGTCQGMADRNEEGGEGNQTPPDVDNNAHLEDDNESVPVRRRIVNRTRNRVIEDDDENEASTVEHALPTQAGTQDDAMAAFGFGKVSASVGLTQMFAGTMAQLESESQPAVVDTEQDFLEFLRSLPETQPGMNFSQASDFLVPNSQSLMSPQKTSEAKHECRLSLDISQVVKTSPDLSQTQPEDFEPTQDAGFSFSRSPAGLVPPPSTVDTVMVTIAESPIKQKRGRLHRGRRETTIGFSDVEDDLVDGEDGQEESGHDIQRPPEPSKDAFKKMQRAAKKAKAAEEFDKKNSLARDAVMDQAEESEDEYAGLGGASDDEEGEEDQELKDMIDHDNVKVDERQIAAFYADKTKKDDEKQLAELYKKMQTKGGLRRHAGGYDGFDMSDSEDEAEMRQRKKRAAFQKQTNALLQDQKVKALADDAKKKAFFNTLRDFADEGEYDYLNMPEKEVEPDASQSQSQTQNDDITVPDSQTPALSTNSPLKRKSQSSQKENRPPPHMRRTAASDALSRKPLTADDVKHSISELIEDPRIVVPDSQLSDAEEDSEQAPIGEQPLYSKPIIDRLTLSRQSTLEESVVGIDSNLAFHNPTRVATGPGFRVPSLIRQATSNLSVSSERSTGSAAAASASKEVGIRRGGTGRSNIHAQAREAERRQMLEKKEGKRKEALRKKVEGGRKRGMRSVLSSLGGEFES